MNKTAIKNFAIWARNKLIADISYRAGLMGITADGIHAALPQSTGQTEFYDIGTAEPYAITGEAIRQRKHLVELIQRKEKDTDYKTAYKYIIEEVAYTWFNRLIAVRFMEVNDYLPSHIRVLSSDTGKLEPDLVTTPFDAELEFTRDEQQAVLDLKNSNKLDEVFRLLFIKQCNALNEILPALFEKTNDYTELLLNLSVIDQDGVVYHLVHDIPEEDFDVEHGGQVEIIGWLYQYYNTEPKSKAFAKKGKITKEEVPAVTQLFTPDWIVRYMVENSLGRLWVEGHPNDELKAGWKYYLEEAEQEPEVQAKLAEIRAEYAKLNPEDIKVIDPCMGSGHILVYAFDVLMQIYESAGYGQRDAARSILENNLYGLDIDDRAFQMAYFAVMMKARQYNRRILNGDYKPNVFSIQESNGINRDQFKYLGAGLNELEKNNAITQMNGLLDTFKDAKEYGSILTVDQYDWDLLDRFVSNIEVIGQMSMYTVGLDDTAEELKKMIAQGKVLAQKYHVTTTNPPYAATDRTPNKLTEFVKRNYSDSKADLATVLLEACIRFTRSDGYMALVTPQAWMFLIVFEKIRRKIMSCTEIVTLLQLGTGAFDGGFGTTSFVLGKKKLLDYIGKYVDLSPDKTASEKEKKLREKNLYYLNSNNRMGELPNAVMAYWCSDSFANLYSKSAQIKDSFSLECGIKNGNNTEFLRPWFSVPWNKVNSSTNRDECLNNMENGKRWFKCNKGGGYKKWYGNYEYVLDLENNAFRIKKMISPSTYRLRKTENYFWNTITWPLSGGNRYSCRFMPVDTLPDVNANIIIIRSLREYCLMGYMNSKVFDKVLNMLNPTLNFPIDTIGSAPYRSLEDKNIEDLVKKNISIAKDDWDSLETSWDFVCHPLIKKDFDEGHKRVESITIEERFHEWSAVCDQRFKQLKMNEELLNRIYIDFLGLQNEVTSEVDDKDVTIRRADLQQDIKSLLSYAIGCMFGRYSIDYKGLAYAGGDWDESKYVRFKPDEDNVIPITDEEYLEDDIVTRLCEFLKITFGEQTLEKNLDYIASSLECKGDSSREIIRNYFLNDFIKDHCKTYSATGSGRCPIYWMFDSGKQDGFKALIYLHRYNADTIGNLRIDYLHRMQRVYENEIGRMQDMIDHSTNAREIGQATKRRDKLTKQLKECREYDEKLAHLALSRIELDLDDGVKVNYRKIQTANDGKFYEILADSKNIMAKK